MGPVRLVPKPLAGYVPATSNPYGITLDREWTEWAADIGVSHTVAAALLLICQGCDPDEIVARLIPGELEQVSEIVGRCPNHFPPGTFDALKSRGLTPSQTPSSASVSTAQAPSQQVAQTSAESSHRYRPYARKRADRPFEHPRSATAAAKPTDTGNSGTHPGTHPGTRPGTRAETARRRMVVEDLWKAGLSVRAISAGTRIPVGSVHRAMRAIARAEAKKQVATAEIANALLGKTLSHRGGGRT
jgi:hypothetical protein